MASDAELVRAAREGDHASLGILLERHRAPLYGVALRLLGHGQQAEDAVHATFLVALCTLDRVREPAAGGGWMRAVLRNVCLMRIRERRGEMLVDEPPGQAERTTGSAAEESLERLALRDWVWTALAELPEALRVTAMLRYFGTCSSYGEIAAILGVPVGTVMSRLNRVKDVLANTLLRAAGLAHDEAHLLSESRARLFDAAYAEYNRGEGYDTLLSAFSPDLQMEFSDGTTIHRGHEFMARDLGKDLEVGLKMHPTKIIASRDVTIIECDIQNPPEDPDHCPPAITQVAFYDNGRIRRMRWHLAPRPRTEGSWEQKVLGPLSAAEARA